MKNNMRRMTIVTGCAVAAVGTISFAMAGPWTYSEEQDWHNQCNFNAVVDVDQPSYNGTGSYTWRLAPSACNMFHAENWPYTSGGYNIGYMSGWSGTSAAKWQTAYDTNKAYGYHTVQNPLGNVYSPALETYVQQ